ncbi:hypothetical protein Tsubulata_034417 [Turnera subulata]|uniref:CCHC-type domain-containing protein n=1 Tax=Turnera subulata TaxID=218843 RepID=A0A9Q0GJL1_9ROSI|nr:hypothetical protein Tsubulata_034417 [Turnera subulata]
MGKREKQRAKIDESEVEEGEEKTLSKSDDEDAEANEDLSLKIVEKALLSRAAKFHQNLAGEGADMAGKAGGAPVLELAESSPSLETTSDTVSAGGDAVKKKRKKKKSKSSKHTETSEHSVVAEGEEKVEVIKSSEEIVEAAEELAGVTEPVAVVEEPEAPVNTVLRKLLRGPRYFDSPDSGGWPACYNCGEEGHMAVHCPSFTKKLKPCFVCGSLEHGAKQCPKGRDCFICNTGGHRAKDCPERNNAGLQSSKICLKCGGSGHDMFSCQNNYSVKDLKAIQCYICKSFGHLCCANQGEDRPREVSCYKCGEFGHTGLACLRLREEGTSIASPSLCFKCGEAGHFARECSSSAKSGKRNRERAHGESYEASGVKSAPHDLREARKKRKTKSQDGGMTTPLKSKHRDSSLLKPCKSKYMGGWTAEDPEALPQSTPRKSKHRGGWLTEDPGESSQSSSKKNRWRSPSTPSSKSHMYSTSPGGYNSHSPKKVYGAYSGMPSFQGSAPSFQHNRYSASRFGNYGSDGGYSGTPSLQGSAPSFKHNSYSASRFGNYGSDGLERRYDLETRHYGDGLRRNRDWW